jgi:excisionase family DNA binding protein
MTLEIDGQTFYSTQEACKLAGTNRFTFLRWVRQNKIADVKFRDRNGWRLFTEDDLKRLKNKVNHVEINHNLRNKAGP